MQYNFNNLEIGGYVDLGKGFEIILDISSTEVLVNNKWYKLSDINAYKKNKNRREIVDLLRQAYPVDTKVQLIKMDDPYSVPVGTKGTVRHVDDMAQIHIAWETGSSLAIIYGEDKILKCI